MFDMFGDGAPIYQDTSQLSRARALLGQLPRAEAENWGRPEVDLTINCGD
jgi:hypothetical protein